jgi:hypothetical protein
MLQLAVRVAAIGHSRRCETVITLGARSLIMAERMWREKVIQFASVTLSGGSKSSALLGPIWRKSNHCLLNSLIRGVIVLFRLHDVIFAHSWLNNFMEQRRSWDANRSPDSQETPRILWNSKIHYRIHKSTYPEPHRSTPCSQPASRKSILILSPIYAWFFQVFAQKKWAIFAHCW